MVRVYLFTTEIVEHPAADELELLRDADASEEPN
jgi:hypothetical protein